MKKAKEQAKRLNENPSLDTMAEIATDFIYECKELIEMRHAKTDAALYSIFNEQEQKWKSFASQCNPPLREDGFSLIVKEQFPYAWEGWKKVQ